MQQVSCEDKKPKGMRIDTTDNGEGEIDPRKVSALTIIGDKIKNRDGEELGEIEEIMIDLTCGVVSYVVLSVGGFAGIGDKFFAIPLDALRVNVKEKAFYLDVEKEKLKKARGFDKNDWPEEARWPL